MNQHGAVSTPKLKLLAEEDLSVYDPSDCAATCDGIAGCVSFNIYFERLPVYEPDEVYCSNPKATVRIGCKYFDDVIDGNMASDVGGKR